MARRGAADRGEHCEAAEILKFLCVMLGVMDTRFAFTLALLVGGYMFGACALVAHAQAQQPLHPTGPPIPTAPGSNVPPPVPTAPGSNIPPPVSTAPGSNVPPPVSTAPELAPPVNEPPSAARTHERRPVAKPVHHRRRSMVAGQTIPFSRRHYWDPRWPYCCCCPIWNYPYDPNWLLRRIWPAGDYDEPVPVYRSR
jgi:hypothetical protein